VTDILSPLGQAAKRLRAALQRETELAMRGAVTELADAAEAKRAALIEFSTVCQTQGSVSSSADADRDALRALLAAGDENANVLDAVRSTLERLSESLRAALEATVNPGIYGPAGRRIGHVPAARLDASA
jgi:predicted TIM-barrel enzyme